MQNLERGAASVAMADVLSVFLDCIRKTFCIAAHVDCSPVDTDLYECWVKESGSNCAPAFKPPLDTTTRLA